MKLFNHRNLIAILILVLLNGCTQNINNADKLIEAHLKAIGGIDAYKAIKTLTFIGTYEEATFKQVHRFDRKRPNFIRVTTNYDEEKETFGYCEGFDGAAWEYSSKIPVRVIGEPSRALRNASTFEKPYIDYKRKGHQAKFLGQTEIKGNKVYHLQIITQTEDIKNYFFDIHSLLETVSIGNAPFHGEGKVIEIFEKRSDYRKVNGVLFSFKAEQVSEGKVLSTMQWNKIEANRMLAENWFSPPLSQQQKVFKSFRLDMLDGKFNQMKKQYKSYKELAVNQLNKKLENQLNTFGYELNSYERYDDAIKVFKLAIHHFPQSANLHDSLGETYLMNRDSINAIKYYTQAVTLNPDNKHAIEVLNKISSEH